MPEGIVVLLGFLAAVKLNGIDKLPGVNTTFIKISNKNIFTCAAVYFRATTGKIILWKIMAIADTNVPAKISAMALT